MRGLAPAGGEPASAEVAEMLPPLLVGEPAVCMPGRMTGKVESGKEKVETGAQGAIRAGVARSR